MTDAARFRNLSSDIDGQAGRVTDQSQCEARLALTLEARGLLTATVIRPQWGDVEDGDQQIWDFKSPHNRQAIMQRIEQRALATGRPLPTLDGVQFEGEFDPGLEADRAFAQQRIDKGVIFDLRRLTADEARDLIRVLAGDDRLDPSLIIFFPTLEELDRF